MNEKEVEWGKEEKRWKWCAQGEGEGRDEIPVQRAQGTMTGYSVSEVAHGEQVNIRD